MMLLKPGSSLSQRTSAREVSKKRTMSVDRVPLTDKANGLTLACFPCVGGAFGSAPEDIIACTSVKLPA
jgi:hypothetical protein